MEDQFNDSQFDKMLYGGVKDLEEPIGRLVYNLWRAEVSTIWSCTGHIGAWLPSSEKKAIDGNYVYDAGKLLYKVHAQSSPLTKKLEQICERFSFAQLSSNPSEIWFALEMQDIANGCNIQGYTRLQVPIEQAKARYVQFLEIWKELTDWSEKNRIINS